MINFVNSIQGKAIYVILFEYFNKYIMDETNPASCADKLFQFQQVLHFLSSTILKFFFLSLQTINKSLKLCKKNICLKILQNKTLISQYKEKREKFTLVMRVSSKLFFRFFLLLFSFFFMIETVKRKTDPNHYSSLDSNINVKLGWIEDFDKFVVNYVSSFILSFLKYQSKHSNIIT
ncbi:hypothetical protein RFI_02023 [Reticulomyxa filosa]|uniref:Transmembrane protein n=1 Tax=Reticulomyxa filosa TaxID=46433 RepID=X6PAG0_RETFI|nr:hypothetical protein RFI_02023 [Reticulomyxa filosa]|eukprot:ETO35049.1 hypothetical protein RFI_02023 [Reticulomyxa filosa]